MRRAALHVVFIGFLVALAAVAGCAGPVGPQGDPGTPGSTGPSGNPGSPGDAGVPGDAGPAGPQGDGGSTVTNCDLVPAGTSTGLHATFTGSAPANGQFFAAGEKPSFAISFKDDCNRPVALASLGTANFYVVGPRDPLKTKTAAKLMNAVTNRAAADRQHHFINLKAPSYADATKPGLVTGADGSLTYTLQPITDEVAGTYTASLWVKTTSEASQVMPQLPFQIGSATVETATTGLGAASSCIDCHKGAQNGKMRMAHSEAGPFGPLGNFSLDYTPVEGCKTCHNNDGYSANPAFRKTHGVHRGEHMTAPGAAHAEYGLPADTTLAAFTNVAFPSMPGAEMDCTKCHKDDAWRSKVVNGTATSAASRLACGSCHDNVFFDSGTINPPRIFGAPASGACRADLDCVSFGYLATCNTGTGQCVRKDHPVQANDAQCSVCHTPDAPGLSSITEAHAIYSRTAAPGLKITTVAFSGATGPNGTYQVNDTPTVTFKLADATANIADAVLNANYSLTAVISGPTNAMQRVYVPITAKSALTYDAPSTTYTLKYPAWPAIAQAPYNTTGVGGTNPAGSYSVYFYVSKSFTDPKGVAQRDTASWVDTVKFGVDSPIKPRQVVTQAACNNCHVDLQLHGGSRKLALGCATCHTQGAVDKPIGTKGLACTSDAQCPGAQASPAWEQCQSGSCTMIADPTPGATIDYPVLVHKIHTARLREGYAERSNTAKDASGNGAYGIVGFRNSLVDFSEVLMPVDPRNCQQCHGDSGAVCTSDAACGVGQSCTGGKCVNTAWQTASARACITCHDSASAFAHASLNTYTPPAGAPIESCDVCHGKDAQFSVKSIHDVTTTLVPPVNREP